MQVLQNIDILNINTSCSIPEFYERKDLMHNSHMHTKHVKRNFRTLKNNYFGFYTMFQQVISPKSKKAGEREYELSICIQVHDELANSVRISCTRGYPEGKQNF